MKRHASPAVAALVAAAVSLALSACNRPNDSPPKPMTGSAAEAVRDDTRTAANQPPAGGPPAPGSSSEGSHDAQTNAASSESIGTSAPAPEAAMEKNPPTAGTAMASAAAQGLSTAERGFLKQAAEDGLYEVTAARLATERASDSAVKAFASMLVEELSMANDKLRQLAASNNLTLPTEVTSERQRQIDKLSKATPGPEFDRQFVQTIGIKDHKNDIDLFEKASRNATSPEVRAFAQSTLSALKAHLEAAKKLPGAGGKA
jgi:putative membrane protein